MNRDPGFHIVREEHVAVHDRLLNWSRYVQARGGSGPNTHPMWLKTPKAEGWAYDELRVPVDSLDGHAVEKAVGQLPEKPREALRWHYVFYWIHPRKVCRYLAVNPHTLAELIHDGRAMLRNRT